VPIFRSNRKGNPRIMRGRKRKANARRRQTTREGQGRQTGATPQTLRRQAGELKIRGSLKDLRRLARNGTLALSENPISVLLFKRIIGHQEVAEADRLRYLWQKLYGPPEARISAYGEFNGAGDPNAFPEREAAEYDHKTTSLQAWTSKWCLGQVLNMAVFRRPADVAAVKRGLRALVIQDFVPVNWETAKS